VSKICMVLGHGAMTGQIPIRQAVYRGIAVRIASTNISYAALANPRNSGRRSVTKSFSRARNSRVFTAAMLDCRY